MNENNKTYYFITVFEQFGSDKLGWPDTGARRCWGFYSEEETAIKALNENWTDMYETIYEYAVLEGYYEGISHATGYEKWFKYNKELNGYFEIKKPVESEHFCNWSIG